MGSPINKLEQVVHDALVARGMSPGEASVTIQKLKKSNQFKQLADIELSDDKQFLAISPAIAVASSPKALCVEWRGQTMWVPFTQIDNTSEVTKQGDCGILVMKRWIAEKKGLVDSNGTIIPAP